MSGFRGGYVGKILWIDLTRRKCLSQSLPAELAYNYVGGYGIGGRILYDEVPPWVSAFDPENLLIFCTGPVNGTLTPVAGRHTVVAKSPLTGFFGDANAGGYWGAELKAADYDLVVISGRAGTVVELSTTLDEYYEARGWDKNTSKPTKEKLIQLGLQDVAKDLWG